MGAAKVIGRFNPVANIRLIFAEILRDFSATGRGGLFLSVVLVFFILLVFYSDYVFSGIFIFC